MQAAQIAGRLLVVGFEGPTLPRSLAASIRRGERGGLIFFRRNLGASGRDPRAAWELARAAVAAAANEGHALVVGVDQEGGRVARVGAPLLQLPSARDLAVLGLEGVEAAAARLGQGLAALGITTPFAPVLDVDSNPDNPVIGDRSFGRQAADVAALGGAFARGLLAAGVFPCGKHFPGHGDTSVDSHLALPRVEADRVALFARDLVPFAAAAPIFPALMSAHVVATGLDPERPATLSKVVLTKLLRDELGFGGVVFSDDLEMAAVGGAEAAAPSAVSAIAAGCDALLVCSSETAAAAAHEALVREIERSPAFGARARQAAGRVDALARRFPSRPSSDPFASGPLSPAGAEANRAWLSRSLGRGAS